MVRRQKINMILFNIEFWIIFCAFVSIYYLVNLRWQNILILAGNFLFLATSDLKSAALCIGSVFFQYLIYSKIIENRNSKSTKLKWTLFGVTAQFSLLAFFKLNVLGDQALPLGISYYSLMLVALVAETYWGRHSHVLNFSDFVRTATFFPMLFMGPIERLARLNQQFQTQRKFTAANIQSGFYDTFLGLFKITAISNILMAVVDHEKNSTHSINGLGLIIYCFLCFIKIYANFSGYINVVQGISSFLGFKLTTNFNQPYLANNIADIWKRWHISLTLWLRDFIYLPILLKTKNFYFGSAAVIFCVGTWHGLSVDYLYWSIYWSVLFWVFSIFSTIKSNNLFVQLFKLNWVAICLTLLATSMSTLCFMIPYHGYTKLMERLIKFDSNNINSLLLSANLSTHKWIFLCIAICAAFIYDQNSYKNKHIHIKILFLIFLCGLLGEIKSNAFLYLSL